MWASPSGLFGRCALERSALRFLPTWLCVLTPVILLLVFITLALHVRIGLGHWPQPMIEDYRTEAYYRHQELFRLTAYATFYGALPCWMLLIIAFPRLRGSARLHLGQAGVYAAGWALIGIYCVIDPGRFIEWLLD